MTLIRRLVSLVTTNAKVGVLLLAFAVAGLVLIVRMPEATSHSPWGRSYLPNVTVVDQDGQQRKFYDDVIKGKIVVISFVYTSCNNICPLVVARLREVQDMLGDAFGRDIHFVSISIDPIPDTPEKLKEQAQAFQTGAGWTFLTGDPENIDLIRHKLGERSKKAISQHKNEVLLYNDRTSSWARESPFSDIGVLANAIQSMDPEWRKAFASQVRANEGAREQPAIDHSGQALFIKTCAACHTVGGGVKVGPDLNGVTERRTIEWITSYVISPDRLRSASDPAALELRRQFPAVKMPDLGMTEPDLDDLISYLKARSESLARASAAPPAQH